MADLKDKVVLVTGGSRGIGAAIVRAVAAEGGLPVLHYGRSAAAAETLRAELQGKPCRLVQADLAQTGAAEALWRGAEDWKGRVDVLINNAGVYRADGIDNEQQAWDRGWAETIQVNLKAAADLCRHALHHFRRRGGGIIINVASRAAFRGDDPDYMAYAASKAGLVALTRTIARGYAAEKILAYVLAPGWVRTDMAGDYVRTHNEAEIRHDIPIGDMAPPEDVAVFAAFLASGKAPHATGATIDINGASYFR